MRTLILNKFLHRNGGSETYIFKLGEALEQHGHEVQYFGMEHEGRCVGNRVNAYTSDMDFHGGSKLSKLEIISQSKDKELSMLMEEFYKISNVYDNLKEAAEFEMQFNSNMNSSVQTSSKISTTTTKSMNSAKKKYMPFFNKNEDKFKLQTIRRQKEPKKVLLNYTAENEKIKKSNITPDNK